MQMYTFVWSSVAILETPSKKTAVILSHLYVIGLKIVLRVHVVVDSHGSVDSTSMQTRKTVMASALSGQFSTSISKSLS